MENEFIKTIQNFTNVSNSIVNNGKNFNKFKNNVERNLEVIVLHINELKKSIKKLKKTKQGIQQNIYKNNENIDNIKTDCESLKNKKLELEKEINILSEKLVQILNEKTDGSFDKNELKKMIDNKNKIEQEIFNLEKENENILKFIEVHKKEPRTHEYYSSGVSSVNNHAELIEKIKHNEETIEELQKLIYIIQNDKDTKSLEPQLHLYEEELKKVMTEYKNFNDKIEKLTNTNLELQKLISEINETIKQVTQKLVSFQDEQHSVIKNNNEINIFIEDINNTINEINSFITNVDMSSSSPTFSRPIIPIPPALTDQNTNIITSNEKQIFKELSVNNKKLYENVFEKLSKKEPNLITHNYILNDNTGREIKLNLREIITELFDIKHNTENDYRASPAPEYARDIIDSKKLIDEISNANSIDRIQDILNSTQANILKNYITILLPPVLPPVLPPTTSSASPKKATDTLNVGLYNAVGEEIYNGLTRENKKRYTDVLSKLAEKEMPNLVSHYYTLIENDPVKLNLPEIISGLLYYIQISVRIYKNSTNTSTRKDIQKNILNADDLIREITDNANNIDEIQNILNKGNQNIFKDLTSKYKIQTEKKGIYDLALREDVEINYNEGKTLTLNEINNCLNNWLAENPRNILRFNVENLKKKIETKRITEADLKNTIKNFSDIRELLDECYNNKISRGGYKSKSKKTNKSKKNNKLKKTNKSKKNNKSKKINKFNKSQKIKLKREK
jgi:predicted  nucleic acid-binding Zn-ribbon protein